MGFFYSKMVDAHEVMAEKRTSYLARLDLAIKAAKKQRFLPVVKRKWDQLVSHTRKCVQLLLAFSMGVEEDAEPESDFPAFWDEVQRRAVAEGA